MSVDTMDTSEVISIVKKAKTDNERLASLLLVCATRRAVYWIDVFEVRLVIKFWAQQEVMFDWTADLTGTGDRPEYTVESY